MNFTTYSLLDAIEEAKRRMSFSDIVRSQGSPRFGGDTFSEERDGGRLNAQLHKVFDLMKDGKCRTLREISEATGCPEQSVSARLRDLRKPRFGSHKVDRQYLGNGLWEYQLRINDEPPK